MIFADELFMNCAAYDWQACNVNQFINNELWWYLYTSAHSLRWTLIEISKFLKTNHLNATVCCSTSYIENVVMNSVNRNLCLHSCTRRQKIIIYFFHFVNPPGDFAKKSFFFLSEWMRNNTHEKQSQMKCDSIGVMWATRSSITFFSKKARD